MTDPRTDRALRRVRLRGLIAEATARAAAARARLAAGDPEDRDRLRAAEADLRDARDALAQLEVRR